MLLDDIVALLKPHTTLPVSSGFMPDDADEIMLVSEYATVPPAPHDDLHPRGLQVRTRSQSYDTARIAAQAAYTALHRFAETQAGGTYITSILAQQEPFPLMWDGKRAEFAVNFRILSDS